MKKRYALLLMAVTLFGCSTTAPTPESVSLTDPAQPIEVSAGETFTVVITSNPSTGYHWEIIGDLNSVEFVSRDYKADEPVMPGSGGMDVWTFKAVSAGETQITLGSYPPGVTDGEPEQKVTFAVKVK